MIKMEMNEELKKWMKEHGIDVEKIKEEKEEKIEGKCMICFSKDAEHKCINCGKFVCLSCFWKMLGICKECITEGMMKKWKEKQIL